MSKMVSSLGAVAFLFSGHLLLAQMAVSANVSAPPLSASQLSSLVQTFQQQQQALAQSFAVLVQQNATSDQIQAWQAQNASVIAAQQQRAQIMAANQPLQPIAYITDVDVPADASQTMEDFLTARANLFNLRAQVYNQQLQSTGTVDEATVAATFQQQNAAALQAQSQRAQTLAQEGASQPMPMPPPLVMIPGASPQLQAFLTAKDQLMRDRIALQNQYATASPAARDAALARWMTQNSARLQQVQQLAQDATVSGPVTATPVATPGPSDAASSP